MSTVQREHTSLALLSIPYGAVASTIDVAIFGKMANARCVYLHYDAAEPAFTMKCVHASSLSL